MSIFRSKCRTGTVRGFLHPQKAWPQNTQQDHAPLCAASFC